MTAALPAATRVGRVRLRVSSLDAAREFYGTLLGLRPLDAESEESVLAEPGGEALVSLEELPGARKQPVFSAGLYHTAFLLPRRADLGHMLRRLVEARWPLQGASDHGVSEALYLADPDGNGVEIYADRPGELWPRQNGQLAMTTARLDIDSLLDEADRDTPGSEGTFPAGSSVGHIHLRVPSIEDGRKLFVDVIGFDVTGDNYPGALFMSAGGYHHHVAMNIWESRGAPPQPGDAAGLIDFEILVPDGDAISEIAGRATASGLALEQLPGGIAVTGAGAIRVLIR
jgi:catechol 2,3-dioxygenase